MRLLVVSGFWPTRSNSISGIFVVQQVQAYLDLGCDVTVIAPQIIRGSGRGRPYHETLGKADVYSPSFIDVPQAMSGGERAVSFNRASCARAIERTLKRHHLSRHCDGIHIHDVRYGALSYPRWGEQVTGPAGVTLHGVDPFVAERATMPWFAHALRHMWGRVAHVTLVGRPLFSYADALGVPALKRSVIHNGSDLPGTWSSDQRPLMERRVVLSVSNLAKLKGIDLNISALARIHRDAPGLDWQYRIIGDGPERAALEAQAKALGIADRVLFLGRLGHPETLAAIADCDVFSLPSWGENFGIVYLEAMGRGRPVIGCKGWGAAEMVRDGTDGLLVEPKDDESLRHALARLLATPPVCEQMGCSARARAEQFTWGANVRRYLGLFDPSAQCHAGALVPGSESGR